MTEQPILVATDLSEPADEAIRQGERWARLRGVPLHVCHVAPRLLGSDMLFPQRVAQEATAQAELQAGLGEQLRERVSTLTGRAETDFELVLTTGKPYAEIVREAERLQAGLVVVGSHATSGLTDIFLGDVAERVVRYAHCPVLVARPHAQNGQLLVATDFSEAAFSALEAAARHAKEAAAKLTLMCSIGRKMQVALSMAELGGSGYSFVQDEYEAARNQATHRLRELLGRVGIAGEIRVTDLEPAAGIVQVATETQAELVVVGAAGRTGLRRLLVGSVAEKVARHAPCSVLVVRTSESQ